MSLFGYEKVSISDVEFRNFLDSHGEWKYHNVPNLYTQYIAGTIVIAVVMYNNSTSERTIFIRRVK